MHTGLQYNTTCVSCYLGFVVSRSAMQHDLCQMHCVIVAQSCAGNDSSCHMLHVGTGFEGAHMLHVKTRCKGALLMHIRTRCKVKSKLVLDKSSSLA